jgi:HEPN domain-containing protein
MGLFYLPASHRESYQSPGNENGFKAVGDSLNEMINLLSEKLTIPEEIKDKAKLLDLFYIPPRYPNGFAAGKPADYFSAKQAQEAIDAADSIIRFCESYLAE